MPINRGPSFIAVLSIIAAVASSPSSLAVMYHRDTGDSKSRELADSPPFTSRANIPGCSAVLIAPNVLLSAAHCVNYQNSGSLTATWNGQSRPGAVFTRIGSDHMVIVTESPFTGTTGRMTAPYAGNSELNRLVWKVGSGGHGIIGPGSTEPAYDGIFRAMTNRVEVSTVSSPPPAVTTDWIYYDFDGPPATAAHATTLYEGGTAPGDSGGPLYMFENGRWWVVGVTSGPDAGFYRDARVRTDMAEIEQVTGHRWARPTNPSLAMRWVAQDLTATLSNGSVVNTWPRRSGTDSWSNSANGGTGTPTLTHNATPTGRAAVSFNGSARLGLSAASKPIANQTAFTVAIVLRPSAAGTGTNSQWSANTGILDANETETTRDWGLALASSGRAGFGIGDPDTSTYSPTSIGTGEWRILVASWDGSEVSRDAAGSNRNISLYVDSVTNVSSVQGPEFLNIQRNQASLTLGGSRLAPAFFHGDVAELRLYRGALDEQSVATLISDLSREYIDSSPGIMLDPVFAHGAAVTEGHFIRLSGSLAGPNPSLAITQTSGPAAAIIRNPGSFPAEIGLPSQGSYLFILSSEANGSTVEQPLRLEALPGLPPSWSAGDIGSTLTGSFSQNETSVTINGAGADIWGTSDAFHFVSKQVSGDFRIQARVASISDTDPWAKAGLMVRDGNAAGARNVFVAVTRSNGITRQVRSSTNGSTTSAVAGDLATPYWLRLERRGNTFSSFRSSNGTTWTTLQPDVTVSIPSTALVGLAVTSHDNTVLNTSVFEKVTIERIARTAPAEPPGTLTPRNIGAASTTGSTNLSSNPARISGSGTGFQEVSDSFRFVSKPFTGDGSITVRVTGFDTTNSGRAFGGIMFRSNLNRESSNVAATIVSGGTAASPSLRFSRRTEAASYTEVSSADFSAPYWLRLTRSGSSFRCHHSPDGISWTVLGPNVTLTDAPQTMEAGVLVASVNDASSSGFSFSNLSINQTVEIPIAPGISLPANQNPSASNDFTITAASGGPVTWAWSQSASPGTLSFRSQNTASPALAFTHPGHSIIRTQATANGLTSTIESSVDLSLDARWNFDTPGNLEGWAGSNTSTPTVVNGTISAGATTSDPQISRTSGIWFSGSLARRVIVRYRGTAAGQAHLYWGRVNATGFASSRLASSSYPTAGIWQELVFDPSTHPDWNDRTIVALRFDPPGGPGSMFEIDWLALADGDPPVGTDPLVSAFRWDANPATAGIQDGAGTWDDTTANWVNGGTNSVWTNANDVVFGAGTDGTYPVSLALSPTATSLGFRNSGYILSASGAQTLTFASTSAIGGVVIAAGKTTTIGSNLTLTPVIANSNFHLTGGGTLVVGNGASLRGSRSTSSANILYISGTTVSVDAAGLFVTNSTSSTQGTAIFVNGDLNVTGGKVDTKLGTLGIGQTADSPAGVLTLAAGEVVAAGGNGVRIGSNSGTSPGGIVNLNGGTLSTQKIQKGTGTTVETSIVNLNGGILRKSTSSSDPLIGAMDRVNVRNGGAVINTNGFAATITQPLEHSNHSGDAAIDGGLTKLGTGTLTLGSGNSYTGPTSVSAGTLAVTGSSIPDSNRLVLNGGQISIAAGANESVGTLFFGMVPQPPGTYGSSSSTAAFKDDSRFAGTGILTVTSSSAPADYEAWATASGLSPADRDPGKDPDGDGLTNFTEYAFGLNPTSGSGTLPAIAPDKSTGSFTYTRRKQSLTGLSYSYESSATLAEWQPFTPLLPEHSDNGNPVETITVTIPAELLARPSLFLRVEAAQP